MAEPVGTVVVTGGSRGLGLATARALALAGHSVVAVSRRDSEALTEARQEVAASGGAGALHFRPADLTDLAALPALVSGLRKEFGRLYGLVNNAGIGTAGVLATMPDDRIESVIRLNLTSPVALTKYVVRSMMAAGPPSGGRIVNMSSIVGSTGYSGLSVYAATKAALVGFTRSLAREIGPLGITVNAVAPGFVETDMTDTLDRAQRDQVRRRSALRRLVEPADVAAAIVFLLGPGGRNVTGTVVTVDAGNTA